TLAVQSGGFCQLNIRRCTDSNDNCIAFDLSATLQIHLIDLVSAVIELHLIVIKDITALVNHLFMEQLTTEDIQLPVQKTRNTLDNRNPYVHLPQTRRHLQAQQSAPDNDYRSVLTEEFTEITADRPMSDAEYPRKRWNIFEHCRPTAGAQHQAVIRSFHSSGIFDICKLAIDTGHGNASDMVNVVDILFFLIPHFDEFLPLLVAAYIMW